MLCVRVARCAVSAHARSPAAIDRGLCRPGTRRFATSKVREIAEDAAGFLVLVSTVGLVVGGGLYALHSLFHPGDTTMRLKKGNQVLHIIGTCHTSPESPTNVAALIPFVKADLVMIEQDVYRVLPGTPTKPGHYAVLTTSASTPSQHAGDAAGSKSTRSTSTTTAVSAATVAPSTPSERDGDATGSESPSSTSTSTTTVAAAEAAKPDQSTPPDFTCEQMYMGDALREAHRVRGSHTLRTALIAAGTLIFVELSHGAAPAYADPYVSGGEFKTALDMARKARIPVLLGDRPFPETLLRAAQEFGTSDIKGSVNLLDEFSFNSTTDRAGGKMGGARWLTDPAKSVLVGERDAHMADVTAHCMAQRKSKSTVMIVGGKHQAGIVSDLCKKYGFKLESRSVPLPVSIWGWGA